MTEADALATELRLVVSHLVRRLRAETRGLAFAEATALVRLAADGPQTTSALAAAENVRPQSMSQTVRELESQGLVERRPDPEDGRQVLIVLSERGASLLEEERRQRVDWLARAIEERLSAREQELLEAAVELLRRLATSTPRGSSRS